MPYSDSRPAISRDYAIKQARKAVADTYTPATYSHTVTGRIIPADEYDTLIHTAAAEAVRAAEARELFFQHGFFPSDDEAHPTLVTHGPWTGFTHSEAVEWCWTLLHHEPVRSSIIQMRVMQAKQQLIAGELPNFPSLVVRARDLMDQGITPEQHRRDKESKRNTG